MLRSFLEGERAAVGPDHETYFVRVAMGGRFDSPRVTRARAGWRFVGDVHEILVHLERPLPARRVPDVRIHHAPQGAS